MKKGFTLIELLAVLALLLIITSIAILDYNKRVNKADEKAALTNAQSYIAEVNKLYLKLDLNEEEPLTAGTYLVNSPNDNGQSLNEMLKVSGTKPIEGSVTISEDFQVVSATLQYKQYVVNYQDETYDVEKKKKNG